MSSLPFGSVDLEAGEGLAYIEETDGDRPGAGDDRRLGFEGAPKAPREVDRNR